MSLAPLSPRQFHMLMSDSELLELFFELDEEEPEEDHPEVEFEIDDSDVDDNETPSLPFDTLGEPSGYEPSPDNITRYRGLFKATMEALKEASSTIIKEAGGSQSMYITNKTDPYPIHPGWVLTFINCDPSKFTDRAIEDVPVGTRSILGDPDLNSDNWVTKFRNLPKVSGNAREFYAGEYIDIVDRLWLVTSPDGRYRAQQIEIKGYKGGTANKDSGARIREHRRYLRMRLPDVNTAFSRMKRGTPYHYEFGSQAAPSKDGPAYQCRSDFRSLGHISDNTDGSKTAWPWVREIVNQILFNMLPGLDSSDQHRTLTDDAKRLVYNIRQKLEADFGQLPDLSHVALNRGCCLMESPRLASAISSSRKTCVKCPKPFVKGQVHKRPGVPWQDVFRLFEPGNPIGGMICDGCNSAHPPPGMKWCRQCRQHKPLGDFGKRKSCARCRRRARHHWRRSRKSGQVPSEPVDSDSGGELKIREYTDAEIQIVKDGMASGLSALAISEVSLYFRDIVDNADMRIET